MSARMVVFLLFGSLVTQPVVATRCRSKTREHSADVTIPCETTTLGGVGLRESCVLDSTGA